MGSVIAQGECLGRREYGTFKCPVVRGMVWLGRGWCRWGRRKWKHPGEILGFKTIGRSTRLVEED